MTNESKNCPEPTVLLSFLQGKLHPPQLDRCESHLEDCQLCHETLAGLAGNDTLSERIVEALGLDPAGGSETELPTGGTDSVEIDNLLNRLNSDDFKRDAMRFRPNGEIHRGSVDSEVIADRAAEVLRCLTPGTDTLGVLGEYELVRLIGAGSTGVVFQAIDQKLDRTVALKVLRPSLGETARKRFLVEAKLAASIEHVNIVTIFQVGQVDRLAYMAMPWLPGQTLETLLTSGEQLPDDQIIKIVSQVAAGLNAAHQSQLVHRDIKPANLWICEDDHQLKILDFGLARISDDDPNLTATGMLAGTPSFMSPEQTRGLELDGRSDLFSLGCVLYRLLTGKLPFGAPTVLAVLSSIQSHHPIPPAELKSDVSQNLSDLTMCLLEKQPTDRPQSATQTIELLQKPRDQWPRAVPNYAATPAHNSATNNRPAVSANTASSGRGWSSWFPAIIGLAMLGTFGWMFAPQIIRVATDQGEVVIETNDDNVEVQVLQHGKVVRVIDTTTHQSFALKSGQYSFKAQDGNGETENSFTIKPQMLTMHRGDKAVVKVTVEQNEEAEVRPPDAVLPAPATKTDKPIYHRRTFAQWLHAAKSEGGLNTAASLECAKTASTDQQWAQLFNVTMENKNFYRIASTVAAGPLFNFVKSEIGHGRTDSQRLLEGWLSSHMAETEGQLPPLPWKHINELTDVINHNIDKPGVPKFLEPILQFKNRPGVAAYLRNHRKSPAGKRIKELALTGDLNERHDVSHLALSIFDDDEVLKVYKRDLFDTSLNERTVGASTPWPELRGILIHQICRAMDPNSTYEKSSNFDDKAEAKYVSRAADLLTEVVDALLDKRLSFSDSVMMQSNWLTVLNFEFFDLAQRTSDENLKNRLLVKLEAIQDLLSSEALNPESLTKQQRLRRRREDLEYVLDFYKGDSAARLPQHTLLRRRTPNDSTETKDKSVRRGAESPKTTSSKKPLFKGKPFEHWIETARFDKDVPTITQAIVACAKIKETPAEQDQLLTLTRRLVREHGSYVVGVNSDSDLYHEAFMAVLTNLNDDQILQFIRKELIEGTLESRRFIYAWMFHVTSGSHSITNADQEQRNRIRMRSAELSDAFGTNLDAPFVVQLAEAMLPKTEDSEKLFKQIRKSSLGAVLKKSVQTGTLTKRCEMANLALAILPDDSQIFEIYRKDLFDPNLDEATVKSEESLWRLIPNTEVPWPVARVNLLSSILRALAPAHWNGVRPQLDPETEARRFATAADLLAEVVDGFLPVVPQGIQITAKGEVIVSPGNSEIEGLKGEVRVFIDPDTHQVTLIGTPEDTELLRKAFDNLATIENLLKQNTSPGGKRKLLLQRTTAMGGGGGGGFSMPSSFEPLLPHRFCRNVLQTIHTIGQRSGNQKVKQSLIKTLTRLEAAMGPDASFAENQVFGPSGSLREEIEYVLANLRGTPIPLPANSRLWNDQQSDLTLNKNTTTPPVNAAKPVTNNDAGSQPLPSKRKPFYKGKQFAHWIEIAEFDRDWLSRSEAILACTKTLDTPEEREQLLKLASSTVRSNGHRLFKNEANDSIDLDLHDALGTVLNSCEDDQIIGFIKTEIAEGNINSRKFCAAWLNGHNTKQGKGLTAKRRQQIQQRINEFSELFTTYLREPGVVEIANALTPYSGQLPNQFIEATRDSALGTEIKKFLKEASLDQRYEISWFALRTFNNDPEVLNVYSSDLFNKKLDTAVIERFGSRREWHDAKTNLLHVMLYTLAPHEVLKDQMNSPRLDPEIEASNLTLAAELLQRFADGLMTEVDQRLILKDSARQLEVTSAVNCLLTYSERVGLRCKDEKIRISLHKKLGQLIDAIENRSPADKDREEILARIEAVMVRLAGGPNVPAPDEESVGEEEPLYQEKGFQPWYEIARVKRDPKTRSNAIYGCTVTAETQEERRKVLELLRPVIRRDGIKLGRNYDDWIDRPKLWELCLSCDANSIFEFVKPELTEGTKESREFCAAWLRELRDNDLDEVTRMQHKEKLVQLAKRVPVALDDIVFNLEQPSMIELAQELIFADSKSEFRKNLPQHVALKEKINKLFETGSPGVRLRLFDLTRVLYPYDEEIFRAHQDDLLNPKLNNLIVQYGESSRVQHRLTLLREMLTKFLSTSYRRGRGDKGKPEKQIAAEVELLQKFVDGFLGENGESLIVTTTWTNGNDGPENIKPLTSLELATEMRRMFSRYAIFFYNSGGIKDRDLKRKTRQAFLNTLIKLKASIMDQITDSNKAESSKILQELADSISRLRQRQNEDTLEKLRER